MTGKEKPVIGPETKRALGKIWDAFVALGGGVVTAAKAGYRDGMVRYEMRKEKRVQAEKKP